MEALCAESICPLPFLELLIDGYFTYVHPLTPVPHEPSFRAALSRRADRTDSAFLALLASMIGCLVSAFPQKLRVLAQGHEMEDLSATMLIEHCRAIINEARGSAFLDRDWTIQDAMTSLLLGLTGVHMFDWKTCRTYLTQCQTIARVIGLHKATWPNCSSSESFRPDMRANRRIAHGSSEMQADLVLRELGRRTFWGLFVAIKSLQQIRLCFGDLSFSPETSAEPYPPLPLEYDDAYITSTATILPPPGTLSQLVGFNWNVKILSSYDQLIEIGDHYSWEDQMMLLQRSFFTMTSIRGSMPSELGGRLATAPDHSPSHISIPSGYDFQESTAELARIEQAKELAVELAKIRTSMQVSNIEINELSAYSYFVSKYWSICDARDRMHVGNGEAVDSSLHPTDGPHNQLAPASDCVLDHQLIMDYTGTIASSFIQQLSIINHGEIEIDFVKYVSHTWLTRNEALILISILRVILVICRLSRSPSSRTSRVHSSKSLFRERMNLHSSPRIISTNFAGCLTGSST